MPTRNVNLPKGLDQFVASRVKSGSYARASEVMRTALQLLEKEEREFEEKAGGVADWRLPRRRPGGAIDGRGVLRRRSLAPIRRGARRSRAAEELVCLGSSYP